MSIKSQKFIAVIGDLVDSKGIADRYNFQKRLAVDLAKVGQGKLASPYTLTLGDEFQALYADAGGLFYDLLRIRWGLDSQRCRFSVSVGKMETPINRRQAIGMDGPAFHGARAGMDVLKKSDHLLEVGGLPEAAQSLWAPAIRLLWASTESWNSNRLRILMGELEKVCPRADAYEFEITQRAIHKNRREARLGDWVKLISSAETQLNQLL